MNDQVFCQAYVECALWSSTDDERDSLEGQELSEQCVKVMNNDCVEFLMKCGHLFATPQDFESAGHDFWLTRNGHGAGFWDGDWTKEISDECCKVCKEMGPCDLYLGDDGKVYST